MNEIKEEYLNRVLDLSYQGGQMGLGALGLIMIIANPAWLRSRYISIALSSIFATTMMSGMVAIWRNFFEGNDLSACRVAAYSDLSLYWYQSTFEVFVMQTNSQ
jgi:hypothetical protein